MLLFNVMREFIYYSDSARTSGNYKDMMKSGRMDIVNHIVIAALFISNKMNFAFLFTFSLLPVDRLSKTMTL